MRRIRSRLFIERTVSFLLLTWVISIYSACSCHTINTDLILQDISRIKHAQELLPEIYKKTMLKSFEGDYNIAEYIQKYIEQENPALNAKQLTQVLLKVSRQYNYDPVFLLAVIKTESQFNPNTIGAAGEIGLMQIKPDTAEWICKKRNIKWLGAEKMKDPAYNIIVGAFYIHYLKVKLASESTRYINAYNMGINNLQRLPASDQKKRAYYGKVISNYLGIYTSLQKYRSLI